MTLTSINKNIKGFTLIEMMISVGILSIFTFALSGVFLHFNSSINKVNTELDIEESYNAIRKLLKEDNGACTKTLTEFEIASEINEIKTKNGDILFKVQSLSADNKISLTKIFLSDFTPFDKDKARGMVRLNLEYTKILNSSRKTYTKSIDRIYIRTDGADTIRSCVSLSHSDCVSSELLLGLSKRTFGSFNKSVSQSELYSGAEIMNSYSKNHEHCVSHAICYEGEWKNISFCKDNFKENFKHSYWAPELLFTKKWDEVESFGETNSNKKSCDAFERRVNCNTQCRNNPLKIGGRNAGISARPGKPIVVEACGDSERFAYYHKNLRCNEFGEWQWDTIVCGKIPTSEQVNRINAGEKLQDYKVYYDADNEPVLLAGEGLELERKCTKGPRRFPIPIGDTGLCKEEETSSEHRFCTRVKIQEERKRRRSPSCG